MWSHRIAAATTRPTHVAGTHFVNPLPLMKRVEVIRALQMGPLALADLVGLDIVLNVMQTLYRDFEDPKYRPSPLLQRMVDAGYLGRKTGRGFFRYDQA